MRVDAVVVEGYAEVLALHRFLFASKGSDLGGVFAGSPYIAAVQNRLVDALEAADPGGGWGMWRSVDGHGDRVDAVRRHLRASGEVWNDMRPEVRAGYVRNLLAPLRVPDSLLSGPACSAAGSGQPAGGNVDN